MAGQHRAEIPAPDSTALIIPKRRLWPVFVVFGAILAVAGFFIVRALVATDPLRILVAIDLDGYWWEGSEPAAKLADELASQLTELGFDPVKGGDPKTLKVLESQKDPKSAAKKLGAGFVIEAHLTPEIVEHPIKEGYFEVRVAGPVTLTSLEKGTTSTSHVHGYAGAQKKDRALALLADSMASQALDAVIAQLIDHPSVREITEGSNVKLLARLDPARKFTESRRVQLAEAIESYAKKAKERETESGGKTLFWSHDAAEDMLVGAGDGGYFVKTADVTPFYSSQSRKLVRHEALETIEWRPLGSPARPTTDEAAPKPMWKGYHVYSYPSSQPDGDRVAFVEDLFGWAKTITIADKGGKTRRIRVDPEHRFVDPRLAPGGRYVAVYDRPEAGAAADLMVLDTNDGKEVFGIHTDNESLGGFTWLDDRRVAFVYVPDGSTDNRRVIAVVDVSRQPLSIEKPFTGKPGEELRNPSASPDGSKLVCVSSYAKPMVVVIDTSAWTRKDFDAAEWRPSWPVISRDGTKVAFETRVRRNTDIALLSLETGAITKLTDDFGDHATPRFSPDGTKVLFEVRYKDPVFPTKRWLSRIAERSVQ
ncbi:MAG: PD40 domain-containing protein [Polyangiaceae bacterium]|nr:PD40 domain-containing protein [Polyangiaceae bacterium]